MKIGLNPLSSYTKGFTLLEVLIAITLTAMVMGSLFAMQSQNKKLTIHSLSALERISQQRLVINASWINLDYSTIFDSSQSHLKNNYTTQNIRILEIPESEQTNKASIKNLKFNLESVDVVDASQQKLFTTIRWLNKK